MFIDLPEACGYEEIAPVAFCKLDGATEGWEISAADFEGGESEAVELNRIAVCKEGQIIAALLCEQAFHLFLLLGWEEQRNS